HRLRPGGGERGESALDHRQVDEVLGQVVLTEDLAEERPVAALALEPPGEPPSARPLEEGEVLGDLLVVDDGDVVLSGNGLDGEGEGAVQGTEFLGLAEDRPESLRAVEATPERMGGAEPVF